MNNSVFNFFRSFFSQQPNSNLDGSSNESNHVNGFRDPIWDTYETDESDIESRRPQGSMFSIYSNPLEIHRFFESRFDEMEQKMNEMMRDFASADNAQNFFSLFDIPASPPALPEPANKNLRDELLKPGFQSADSSAQRVDKDLDGRIDSKDIGRMLDKKGDDVTAVCPFISPSPPHSPSGFSSFSKSFVSRTVRHPDGTVEREDISRDSSGNEKKTVTRRKPDGEETVVTIETPAASSDPGQNPLANNFFRDSEMPQLGDMFGNSNRRSSWWSW